MFYSQLYTKTLYQDPTDEVSTNAKLLIRAGFIEKLQAGVYNYLPLGKIVLEKISNIIRQEMNQLKGREILLASLHPKENWEKTDRWQTFDALYRLKSKYGTELALGPTHEEVIVPLAKKYISSYKDLPIYFYQIQTKFRDEPRPKSGLLRTREFLMKDFYSFHTSKDDMQKFYEKVKHSYNKIFKRCGLDSILTEASGGSFSPYSHEFQVLTPSGEDIIFYCQCGFAQNQEISKLKEDDPCPQCRALLKKGKAIEVGNIFDLGTKFSSDFQLTYEDASGKGKLVIIGCYGIGVSRLMGAIVEIYHDSKGIIWPKEIAPFLVHLISLPFKDKKRDQSIKKASQRLYLTLQKSGIEVLYDDRLKSGGEKFIDADLIGIPWRIVISERTLQKNSVEIKERAKEGMRLVKIDKVLQFAHHFLKNTS